jgi:hypothetical protein
MGAKLSGAQSPAAEAVCRQGVSRRTILRRLGRSSLVATAGAGVLEFAGVAGASARTRGRLRPTADNQSTSPVIVVTGTAEPDSCACTGHLAEGRCSGGPCPPGFYCYEVDYCGGATTKYACLNCPGTPTCSYDCS